MLGGHEVNRHLIDFVRAEIAAQIKSYVYNTAAVMVRNAIRAAIEDELVVYVRAKEASK